jgi:hypothetical protein
MCPNDLSRGSPTQLPLPVLPSNRPRIPAATSIFHRRSVMSQNSVYFRASESRGGGWVECGIVWTNSIPLVIT